MTPETPRHPLYLVTAGADLAPMTPSAPATEDEIQALIAAHPALIGDGDGGLLLVEREMAVPDAAGAGPRWALDHLYLTREATPVLVEVKRAGDTRLRREVLGQMLDYAANATVHWPADRIARRFEQAAAARGEDPAVVLAAFLGDEARVADFWNQVDANLRAGKIRMVFVADQVPAELARIVEFLNEQMRAQVLAVELTWFCGPDGSRVLAPRVIGETQQSRAQKRQMQPAAEPISVQVWLETCLRPDGDAALAGARALLALLEDLADEVVVAPSRAWLQARIKGRNGRMSSPFLVLADGSVQIAFGWLGGAPGLADMAERRRFYDRFVAAVGPLSTANLNGFPSFQLAVLAQAHRLEALREVAHDFAAACRT